MKRAVFAGALASAALALAGVTPAASATQLTNVSIPLNFSAPDPCVNNGIVTFSGVVHELVNIASDGAGGFNVKMNVNTAGVTGVDSNGGLYVFNEHVAASSHVQAGQNETAPVSEHLVSQGSAPNSSVKFLLHLTVDANGNATSSVDSFSITCKG